MKSIKSTLTTFAIGVLAFAVMSTSANESEDHNVMVQVQKMDDSDALVDLKIDGNTEVFSLPELEIGESRDIVTESGKVIYLSRTEDSLTVSVDGEIITLPHVSGDMQAHFIKDGVPLHINTENNIQVIGELTEEQIMIIKDAFAAAGVKQDVSFTKGREMKFFFSGDEKQLGNVHEWLEKDGEDVKIVKINNGGNKIHVRSKVIFIDTDKDEN